MYCQISVVSVQEVKEKQQESPLGQEVQSNNVDYYSLFLIFFFLNKQSISSELQFKAKNMRNWEKKIVKFGDLQR